MAEQDRTPVASPGLIDPAMAAAMARAAELVAADGGPTATVADNRAQYVRVSRYWNEDAAPVASVRTVQVETPAGPRPARLYRPVADPVPVVVFLHGGGWVRGNPDTCDSHCRLLASASGLAVLSLDYRLAPEHPFPAALDDVVATLDALRDPGVTDDYGVSHGRVFLSGGSAGANLALAATLRERDQARPLPEGLALFYGVYDCDLDTPSYRQFGDGTFGLSRERMAGYLRAYVPDGTSADEPYLWPLRSDVQGLPPAWFGIAELDVLRDEQLRMAERMSTAGVHVDVRRYAGLIHGFGSRTRTVHRAAAAVTDAARFLKALAARG
ncbi:alpha/beta hydrolase [Streptomyces sp. NPDC004752]